MLHSEMAEAKLYLLLLELMRRRLVHSMLRMRTRVQQDQALQQQSPPEGCIPQLQLCQFAAGQVLDNHALPAICKACMRSRLADKVVHGRTAGFTDAGQIVRT